MTTERDPVDEVGDDTGFPEPPRLRRLGTLAELTQGSIEWSSGDANGGGFSGDGPGSF